MATASRNPPEGSYSPTFVEMFRRLITAAGRSRSAKTVEVFGWLILIEGALVLFVPHLVASVLQIQPLEERSANYFRLVGLLVGGLGILYIVSGRLNARGFVFASMLDRPLVLWPWQFFGIWGFSQDLWRLFSPFRISPVSCGRL